jgi:exonuclease VII large subunit
MTGDDLQQIRAIVREEIAQGEERHTERMRDLQTETTRALDETARDLQTETTRALARNTEHADETARDLQTEITRALARNAEHADETARDLQTEILRGLEAFARGNFARFHTVESNQTDINTRMAALEERVLYLETRRPPQP